MSSTDGFYEPGEEIEVTQVACEYCDETLGLRIEHGLILCAQHRGGR